MKNLILWAQKYDEKVGSVYAKSDNVFDLSEKANNLLCHRSDYKHIVIYDVKNYSEFKEVQRIW